MPESLADAVGYVIAVPPGGGYASYLVRIGGLTWRQRLAGLVRGVIEVEMRFRLEHTEEARHG